MQYSLNKTKELFKDAQKTYTQIWQKNDATVTFRKLIKIYYSYIKITCM